MGILTMPNDDQIKDCTCKYCGFVGKPYQFPFVYECDDFEKKMRKVRVRCPECNVLDTIRGSGQYP